MPQGQGSHFCAGLGQGSGEADSWLPPGWHQGHLICQTELRGHWGSAAAPQTFCTQDGGEQHLTVDLPQHKIPLPKNQEFPVLEVQKVF